jgi:hypothetical protein
MEWYVGGLVLFLLVVIVFALRQGRDRRAKDDGGDGGITINAAMTTNGTGRRVDSDSDGGDGGGD